MNGSSIPPELAWQMTLAQLQMDMPNAAARLTRVDETPIPHTRSTIAVTLRVETPWTYISASARLSARSLRSLFSSACG
jgi:hypothetical protein